ncbi:hypothetical protein ACJMK2_018235, partial [Sinanodonta woodiana]
GSSICEGAAARLASEFQKSLSQQGSRPQPQPAHSHDMRASMSGLSLGSLGTTASLQPFSGLSFTPVSVPGPASGANLNPALLQYPAAIYPSVALGASQSNDFRAWSLYQAVSPIPFPGDISKMKSPIINRNYLELAMLVCNTFRGKLFPCPHCRYVTDRRNNLKRHISTMHQACEKVLECCGVTFSTKSSLREHIMIFHHNGYSCPYCGRRFCRKALLKRHLSVHSGQKDYTCPHCDYATSHKSNLERHKRIHERLKLVEDNTGVGYEDFRSTHDPQQLPDTTDSQSIIIEDESVATRTKTFPDSDDSDSDLEVEVGHENIPYSDLAVSSTMPASMVSETPEKDLIPSG